MKSIKNTLEFLKKKIQKFSKKDQYNILCSLIGGQAFIFFGVPRISLDIDICMIITDKKHRYVSGEEFAKFLIKELPLFHITFHRTDIDGPLHHDFIRLEDKKNRYPVIDILFVNYKWEIDGIKKAVRSKDIPIPIFPKSYLIAMKIKAGGLKDKIDIIEMFGLMNRFEQKQAFKLLQRLHMDKKLTQIISQKQ